MGEAPLKAAMIRYGLDILGLSILISIITAALVYLSLDALLVKPMTKLTWNIVRFSRAARGPDPHHRRRRRAATRSAPPSASSPPCRQELAETLSQKSRLAALGLAVSKISHDLRNMLSSAQLLSDRLITVKDPDRAAPGAEADRLARPRHQAVRPHPRLRPGAGDAAAAQALPARPARRRDRRQPRSAASEAHRLDASRSRRSSRSTPTATSSIAC